MELELQKEHFECYRPCAPIVSTREETAETIVPDYSPDIARIVDTNACLLLRSRTVADGKLTVSGSVKLTLLYMADGAQGLRSLEYAVPFEYSEKLPEGCEKAAVEGRVCGVEARTLNPRKLFTRMDIEWKMTPYCRMTLSTCGKITDQAEYAIQTLCEKHEISLIESVGDEDFVFSEELSLPGGRDAIGELLCSRVKPRITEVKSIGSKVVLKGVACVSLLYTAEDGKLCCWDEELPFSQILSGISAEENGDVSASAVLNLSGCEIHTSGEGSENRAVSVKLFFNAFIVLRRTKTVECIVDLYSTVYDLDAQTERVELWQSPAVTSITQSVREQFDVGMELRCVLGTDVCFGSVGVSQSGGHATARAAATVSILYLDESNVPFSLDRRIEVTAEADTGSDAQAGVENVCAGDVAANINANGVEVRFPAEFTFVSAAAPVCDCLTSLSAAEPETQETPPPSLVLRALCEEETLWDVAKRYRTTVEELLSANELTDSSAIVAGRMLLIPRKR